jgi:hypothetical protein
MTKDNPKWAVSASAANYSNSSHGLGYRDSQVAAAEPGRSGAVAIAVELEALAIVLTDFLSVAEPPESTNPRSHLKGVTGASELVRR